MKSRYESIVEGCKHRKSDAQRALYEELSPMVFGVCLRYADSRDDAKDMMQDAFVKVYERIGSLKDPSRLRVWTYNIAINTCIDAFRRRRMMPAAIDIGSLADEEEEPLAYTMDEMVAALQQITSRQRMVFNMCCIEEMPADKVAERLGCTASNVRAVLCDARRNIRNILETKNKNI